jgi:hypothetical protein
MKFKNGDLIEVVHSGASYTTHSRAESYIGLPDYNYGVLPTNGQRGRIIGNPLDENGGIYGIETLDGSQYIIGGLGLELINKGEKEMKKSDLKKGMICVMRDGDRYMYIKGENFDGLVCGGDCMKLSNYASDLTFLDDDGNSDEEFDIVEVLQPKDIYQARQEEWGSAPLIWERQEEVKELTIAELEKTLGYTIKIVK